MSTDRKFIIFTPHLSRAYKRLKIVGRPVVKIAGDLRADVEVYYKKEILSIFVYYKSGNKEKVPVYCDWGKNWSEEDIYHAVGSVIYAPSLHPEYVALQTIRNR